MLFAHTSDVNAGTKDHCEENEHWYEHDETTPNFLQHWTNPFSDVLLSFQQVDVFSLSMGRKVRAVPYKSS